MTTTNLRVFRQISVVLGLACLFFVTAFAQNEKSADAGSASVAGTWKMISETPDGDSIPWTLTISQKDGHWTGMVAGPDGPATPASDFKVTGDKVHLQTQYQGSPYDIDLTMVAGALTGTWSGDNGNGKTTGKRAS